MRNSPLTLSKLPIPFRASHQLRNQLLDSSQPFTYITISAVAWVADGVACVFASRFFAAFNAVFAGKFAVTFCSVIVSIDFPFDDEKGGDILSYTTLFAGRWPSVPFTVSVHDLYVSGVHGVGNGHAENVYIPRGVNIFL